MKKNKKKRKSSLIRMAREDRAEGEIKNEYKQEVDTNIVAVNFSVLKEQGELATGDPLFCERCKALFSKFSVLSAVPVPEGEERKEHE